MQLDASALYVFWRFLTSRCPVFYFAVSCFLSAYICLHRLRHVEIYRVVFFRARDMLFRPPSEVSGETRSRPLREILNRKAIFESYVKYSSRCLRAIFKSGNCLNCSVRLSSDKLFLDLPFFWGRRILKLSMLSSVLFVEFCGFWLSFLLNTGLRLCLLWGLGTSRYRHRLRRVENSRIS